MSDPTNGTTTIEGRETTSAMGAAGWSWYQLEEHLQRDGLDAALAQQARTRLVAEGDPRAAAILVAWAAGEAGSLEAVVEALEALSGACASGVVDLAVDALDLVARPIAGRGARDDRLAVVRRLEEVRLSTGARLGDGEGGAEVDRALARRGLDALREAVAVVPDELAAGLDDRVAPVVAPLAAVAGAASSTADEALPTRSAVDVPTEDGAAVAPTPGGDADSAIRSPRDVVAALDRICAWYERHEPSSPVPLVLRRARALVGASFADILAAFDGRAEPDRLVLRLDRSPSE